LQQPLCPTILTRANPLLPVLTVHRHAITVLLTFCSQTILVRPLCITITRWAQSSWSFRSSYVGNWH
jgi:hypothetical protein